ncbi:MAG: 4Fe-4S ferredoxin [Thermoprotei archaeon]|nr:4Fe-4S ferredoxin [Thermoprotei archaeon]
MCRRYDRRLIDTNACPRDLRRKRKLLLFGRCLRDEHPEVLEKFADDYVPLSICLEAEHMNMVGFKLASMLARMPLKEIIVLTVDGSPHCVQLHMMVEEVNRIFNNKLNTRHFVVEGGKLIEVSRDCVKTARYLSKIKRLLEARSHGH